MGICNYCGKPAGFLKSKHPECERIHFINVKTKSAIAEIERIGKNAVAEINSTGKPVISESPSIYSNATENNLLFNEFTDREKEKLNAAYQKKRIVYSSTFTLGDNLDSNKAEYTARGKESLDEQLLEVDNPVIFLADLVQSLDNVEDFPLCKKIFDLIDDNTELKNDHWFLHFHYITKMKICYRNRNEVEGAFGKAMDACMKMIRIAKHLSFSNNKSRMQDNPSHPGYKQLSIVLFKYGKFEEVIKLCTQAKSQHWKGDWDDRIAKAKAKFQKLAFEKPRANKTKQKDQPPYGEQLAAQLAQEMWQEDKING